MSFTDPSWWSGRFDSGSTPWDLGGPTPVLAALLESGSIRAARAAVPGCGRGWDVGLLASKGIETWGFDFSEAALAAAPRPPGARYECRDVFRLAADHAGRFDLVWEYTCYCAIEPARRAEYLDVLRELLVPGGELAALLFPVKEREGGPPFAVRAEEVGELFAPRFDIVSVGPPDRSVPSRRGFELLVRARKPG